MQTLERKTLAPAAVELKGDAMTMTGLVSERSLDLGGDIIAATAYDKWLADFKAGRTAPVTLNLDHSHQALATVGLMTSARIARNGLEAAFAFVPDDPTADAARKRVEMGVVTGLSIGYTAQKSRAPSAEERRAGVLRVLEQISIVEVSLVQMPMQPRARVLSTSGKDALPRGWDMPPAEDRQLSRRELRALSSTVARVLDAGKLKPADAERIAAQIHRVQTRRDDALSERLARVRRRVA